MQVHLVYDHETGKTLEVTEHGFCGSVVPRAINATEALWFIENLSQPKKHYRQ